MSVILVADDEVVVRSLLKRYLESVGHQVLEAADGQQAMEALASGPVDILITDIMMPQMDGLSLIRKLRANGSGVRIIAIAGWGVVPLPEALASGADAAIEKPVDLVKLGHEIRKLLNLL